MKRKIFALAAVYLFCFVFFGIPAAAVTPDGPSIVLDYAGVIPDGSEAAIAAAAARAAENTGFNIAVVTSDDIGEPKTDAHVVEYADDLYEELYGINTDGILLLINCDTKYDYISTSGSCINYFSDARIDAIFDGIWDDLVDGNYGDAAYMFVGYVETFYESGKANNQHEVFGREVDRDPAVVGAAFFPITLIGLVIGIAIFAGVGSQYKIQKPGTRNYILENSLVYDINKNTFAGTIVNRIYTPRSSGSSSSGRHSSGGSHRSSTHHSRSGGRHGGGGRHR